MVGKTDHIGAQDAASGAHDDEQHSGKLRKKMHDFKVSAIHLKHKIGKFENLFNSNHRSVFARDHQVIHR